MNIGLTRSTTCGAAARRVLGRISAAVFVAGIASAQAFAQTAFTWQQIKEKFQATNPTLKAAQANIDESRAAQITAYLRPNPVFTITAVPAPSLATGRVVEIAARLGDEVQKGQLLFKVRSTDVAGAYPDYRKAVRNEQLAKIQLDRAKTLYEHGAIPRSALETAQTTEDNAIVDLETTTEHLRLLGSDPKHPSGIVEVYAPVSGVITDQQNIRTAKVRLEVDNPGILRLGMFVTATFHALTTERHAALPAAAILHLHDREWVYMPAEKGYFRRVEVSADNMLADNNQEILSGVRPGDRAIANALVFQNTVERK